MKKWLAFALLLSPLAAPLPALAQDRILTIFGDDKCPENTICVRARESERFRIPKDLRQDPLIAPNRQAWAAKAQATLDAGSKSGTGSCTAIGPGGHTGCFVERARAAKAERQQAAKQNATGLEDGD